MNIQKIKSNYQFLLIMSLFATTVLLTRIAINQEFKYLFLLWNLFLAFVPYSMSLLPKFGWSKLKLVFWTAIWLLFWPNAPYLITDFVHLKKEPTFWLDLAMFFMFAITGFLYAYFSFLNMITNLSYKFSKRIITVFRFTAIPLAAFGIYLGRVERLNSWDAMVHPLSTGKAIFTSIVGTGAGDTLLFTMALSIVFYVVFLVFNYLIYYEVK